MEGRVTAADFLFVRIQHIIRLLTVSSGLLFLGGMDALAVSLPEALNAPFVAWTTGGTTNLTVWGGQTNVFRVDGQAAGSGAITNNQTTWVETTVSGVTNVSFWWKVSSEENYDYLTFYINGQEKAAISGEVDWQLENVAITNAGTNVLRWSYSKDSSDLFDVGADRGWVDEVGFNQFTLSTPVRLADGRMQFNVNFSIGLPCRVLYSTNLATGGWTLLVSTNTTSAATVITDSGATNSRSRFYRAESP